MPEHILVGVAWPYANGPLHLGHIGGAYLPADIFARYHRLAGNQVLMVSGSDQHGTPITVRAEQEGCSPAEVAARYHQSFLETWQKLGVQWELFTRTGTDNHRKVVQDLFLVLYEKGYIYLDTMKMQYCLQDKRFLADRYVEGTCPNCKAPGARGDQCDACTKTIDALDLIDPRCKFCGSKPEIRETEHFFCKWSAFAEPLKAWIADKTFWKPNVLGTTRSQLDELRDSAVSRDMEWGIPVPVAGYEHKRIYVWFDAVIGYLSASIEWAALRGEPEKWREWWEDPQAKGYYFIGKDNIPFHTIRWPAMLLGRGGLNLPYNVPSNEYLTLEGRPFSTSRNWAVWVPDFLERYDADPLRYFMAANMPESSDSDFSWQEFLRRNNNELVNNYGNLVHRTFTQVHRHFEGKVPSAEGRTSSDNALLASAQAAFERIGGAIGRCSFREAIRELMAVSHEGNGYIDSAKPWATIKEDRARTAAILSTMLDFINALRVMFIPFLPNSSAQLHTLLGHTYPLAEEKWAYRPLPSGQALQPGPAPLFKKLDDSIVDEEVQRLGGQPA